METITCMKFRAYEQPEAEVVTIESESILDGFASEVVPNRAGEPTSIELDEF